MKKISLLLTLIFLMAQVSWAATYNSTGSNAPNLTGSWSPPPSNFTTAGDIFIIQAGHTMTTTATWSVTGTVQINGTLVASNTVTIGTLTVNSGGTYQHNINGGTVPNATWNVNSTLLVTGITSTLPIGVTKQNLGNLTWNCPGQSNNNTALGVNSTASDTLSVSGNLEIDTTGIYSFRCYNSPIRVYGDFTMKKGHMLVAGGAAKIMNVGGDVNISGGTVYVDSGSTASGILNVGGAVTVSGGTLDISLGTSSTYQGKLTVAGDFSITGTGVVKESGSVNNSVIVFNGSSLQTITNSGTLSGSLNFSFDNSSGISLGSDWSIALTDTMRNGNIALNGHTLTLGSSASSTGTLIWTSGLITGSGTFKRWFGTSAITLGNIAGQFPMGSGANNRSVWIGGTPSAGGTVSVQHSDAADMTALTFSENSQSFTKRTNMSWSLSTTNSFAGSSLSLRIQGSGITGVNAVTDLNISTSAVAAGGTYAAPGGTTANPQVNRTGLTQTTLANTFYFAATVNSPLPVELTSFTGSVNAGIVILNWATAIEVNNFGFNVERLSGQTWQNIGFVQGAGNSNSVKKYCFVDNSAKAGNYSYRLQQIDNGNAYKYSLVIEVNNGTQPTSFSIGNYPNPFNPSTTIRYALPVNTFVNITICNILGQKVATLINQNMEQGVHEVSFDASSFASGTYIYRIEAGSFSATKKMLLIK
jgi:hypothetical protein